MRSGKNIFILLLVIALSMTFASVVNSETGDSWKGYGLYNINGSKINILSEEVNVELLNDRLAYSGDFIIRNNSSGAIKAVLGMPVQGIDKITFMEKNSLIKYKKRSLGSMQNEFGTENRIPKEEYWYVFSLSLNPGETKLLNISLEAVQLQEEQGSYTFFYYNDRKLGFSNRVDKTSLNIDIPDFQIYNILSIQGIDPGLIGTKGDIVLKSAGENVNTVAIKYMDVTKAAIGKLQASAMYKPKEIANAFLSKNYSKASTLVDEYLKNPIDSGISQDDIIFIKAESLRRLQNNDKYLAIAEAIDFSKLYPAELKNKILMDRLTIYIEQQNNDKLLGLYGELEKDTSESTQILRKWVESSNVLSVSQFKKEDIINKLQQEEKAAEQYNSKLKQWYKIALEYKYTPIIIFAFGLILGLILRGSGPKRKKKRSMYIYR